MPHIPLKEENPKGLHAKYLIRKIVGWKQEGFFGMKAITKAVDKNAEYFIMRLDEGGKDREHIKACRIGVHAYANAIEHHLPELAKDLQERYPLLDESTPPVSAEVCDCCGSIESHLQCVCHNCRNKWTPQAPPVSARENGWVKVEDRLPENEDEVLVVHTEAGGISIAFYCDELKRWVPTDTDIERNGQILVTHWRPLPPPPSK